MRQESYKPKMPDLMEAIFDAGYLIFDLIAAIIISFECYIVQQEKTDGWSVDDSEDMCLHVDNCNGTSVVILDNRKK